MAWRQGWQRLRMTPPAHQDPSRDWVSRLDNAGFYRGDSTTMEDFAATLAEAHDIIDFEQVRELATTASAFHSHRAMSLHTDHCDADRVAWWCKQPATTGGESLLLDAHEVLRQLAPDERDALARVRVRLPDEDEPVPLLRREHGSWRVYYAEWLTHPPGDAEAARALQRFEDLLRAATPVRLRLERGQWLIIDNHRVMHGRAEFAAHTGRHLLRLWLARKAREPAR